MSAPSSDTLYRWRKRLLAIGPFTIPGTDVENLEANEEISEIADDLLEAYVAALQSEIGEMIMECKRVAMAP